jgi:hypothetical protein
LAERREFKILARPTGQFGDPIKLLAFPTRNLTGRMMLEKFDNRRVRLKRLAV